MAGRATRPRFPLVLPGVQVLFEDNHLLAVFKPAELPTMGVAAGDDSMLERAREYVRRKYHKPGNVYLGVVSRLDAPVTGVLLLARTSKAAARLTEQFRARTVEKIYWAVVAGRPSPAAGACHDWVLKDERQRRMVVVPAGQPDAQEAVLRYQTLGYGAVGTLLEVQLETGRKHQIRLQLASRGWPVWGDRRYGSTGQFSPGIALHARRLVFQHPVGGRTVRLQAPLPASWRRLGVADPGAEDAPQAEEPR